MNPFIISNRQRDPGSGWGSQILPGSPPQKRDPEILTWIQFTGSQGFPVWNYSWWTCSRKDRSFYLAFYLACIVALFFGCGIWHIFWPLMWHMFWHFILDTFWQRVWQWRPSTAHWRSGSRWRPAGAHVIRSSWLRSAGAPTVIESWRRSKEKEKKRREADYSNKIYNNCHLAGAEKPEQTANAASLPTCMRISWDEAKTQAIVQPKSNTSSNCFPDPSDGCLQQRPPNVQHGPNMDPRWAQDQFRPQHGLSWLYKWGFQPAVSDTAGKKGVRRGIILPI